MNADPESQNDPQNDSNTDPSLPLPPYPSPMLQQALAVEREARAVEREARALEREAGGLVPPLYPPYSPVSPVLPVSTPIPAQPTLSDLQAVADRMTAMSQRMLGQPWPGPELRLVTRIHKRSVETSKEIREGTPVGDEPVDKA